MVGSVIFREKLIIKKANPSRWFGV